MTEIVRTASRHRVKIAIRTWTNAKKLLLWACREEMNCAAAVSQILDGSTASLNDKKEVRMSCLDASVLGYLI